jgi:2-hydroxychromene-2-carboxylate isomerase
VTVRAEFHFDFGSPNAYLAHLVLPAIRERTGVAFDYVPVLIGGIFKATNNQSPALSLQGIKNKPEYQAIETRRFLGRHGITSFRHNPHFPVNTLQLMRGCYVARQEGCFERYVDEVYRHMWSDPKKMDDPEVARAALEESGLPAAAILERDLLRQGSSARGRGGDPGAAERRLSVGLSIGKGAT